ncbi:MAG: endonuclease domain-containing protein [Prevotella sp.]|nr:endonuclease domain-containing protein [Prevotella sp.]
MDRKGYETAAREIYDLLKEYAKSNREEMTESEKVLWNALRDNIQGYRFRRQHAIGQYIADFVCLPAQLVIEVDGGYHQSPEQQEMDNIRTNYLKEKGFHVVRFSNEEVSANIKGVIQIIKDELIRLEEQSE